MTDRDLFFCRYNGSVSFTGIVSGDNECFCWDDVPADQWARLAVDPEFAVSGRLYPGDVLSKIGVVAGQRYRFIITAIPMQEASQ